MKQISVTEYAKLEGITRQAVLKRIKARTVKAKKIGNTYVITIKAMKNLILILAIAFCSCKKHHEDPISKSATLHIEYSATFTSFTGNPYQSKVVIYFSDKSPLTVYSAVDKYNIISTDLAIQGGQQVTIVGSVIDSTGSCACHGIPPSMSLTFNAKSLSSPTVSGVAQYKGTLEFIN